MVGGVSIGAFMGALWCMEKDINRVSTKAKTWAMVSNYSRLSRLSTRFSPSISSATLIWWSEYEQLLLDGLVQKMTQIWRQLLDLTYPVTSMFTGAFFNQMIRDTFGEDFLMEDLWLPYFTVTTDITSSCMRLHSHGIPSLTSTVERFVRKLIAVQGWPVDSGMNNSRSTYLFIYLFIYSFFSTHFLFLFSFFLSFFFFYLFIFFFLK